MSCGATANNIRDAIKALHARKHKAYGDAWKRRGERISIVPNIARKVDRLAIFAGDNSMLRDEHILDTAVDLYVYSLKYRLFIAEQNSPLVYVLPLEHPVLPLSDRTENFDQLVDADNFAASNEPSVAQIISRIVDLFELLWPAVEKGANGQLRFDLANRLSDDSNKLILQIARKYPNALETFVQNELKVTKGKEAQS